MRTLVATFVAVSLIQLIALPFSQSLALVTIWAAVPLLIEALWASTDAPRSRLVRGWLVSLPFLLAMDTLLILLDGPLRLGLASGLLLIAASLQSWALWDFRHETLLTYERGWSTIFILGLALLIFAAAAQGALGVLVFAAGAAVALMALLASGESLMGAGGGMLSFTGALIMLITSSLGASNAAISVGTAAFSLAGQAVLALMIIRRENLAHEQRRSHLVHSLQWDGATPVGTWA